MQCGVWLFLLHDGFSLSAVLVLKTTDARTVCRCHYYFSSCVSYPHHQLKLGRRRRRRRGGGEKSDSRRVIITVLFLWAKISNSQQHGPATGGGAAAVVTCERAGRRQGLTLD